MTSPDLLNLRELGLEWPNRILGPLPAGADGGFACGNMQWMVAWNFNPDAGVGRVAVASVDLHFPHVQVSGLTARDAAALLEELARRACLLQGSPLKDPDFKALTARLAPSNPAPDLPLYMNAAQTSALLFMEQMDWEAGMGRILRAEQEGDERLNEALDHAADQMLNQTLARLREMFPRVIFREGEADLDLREPGVEFRVTLTLASPSDQWDAALEEALFQEAERAQSGLGIRGWSGSADLYDGLRGQLTLSLRVTLDLPDDDGCGGY